MAKYKEAVSQSHCSMARTVAFGWPWDSSTDRNAFKCKMYQKQINIHPESQIATMALHSVSCPKTDQTPTG